MKTLIIGAGGQLATYLAAKLDSAPPLQVNSLSIDQFDVTSPLDTQISILKEINPDIIINCAAYTQVDKAESEKELAKKINGDALTNLSLSVNEVGAELIHISTDFVFSGDKGTPYTESDPCEPINVYGETKLLGEQNIINNCKDFVVFRTSWLYSSTHPSFYKTMLQLAQKNIPLRVIYDQVGSPTSAPSLANAIHHYIQQRDTPANKIYHTSNEGVCSWYDFAHGIFKTNGLDVDLSPIETHEYPTPAKRPTYSILSKQNFYDDFSFRFPHWTDALEDITGTRS